MLMKYKRYLAPLAILLVFATLLTVLIVTGGQQNKEYKGISVDELMKGGVLKVAFIEDCSPYVRKAADGSLAGIEVDILRKVCEKMGLTLEGKLVSRNEAMAGVTDGTYHLVAGMLSGSTQTPRPVIYTNPYNQAQQMILCKLDGAYENLNSLSTENIGVKVGSYAEALMKHNQYTYTSCTSYAQAISALEADEVAAVMLDRWTAEELIAAYPEAEEAGDLILLNATVATTGYCFVMAPGCDEVINQIDITVSQLAADGVLNSVYDSYGVSYYSPY